MCCSVWNWEGHNVYTNQDSKNYAYEVSRGNKDTYWELG